MTQSENSIITRHRMEPHRRSLSVVSVQDLTPHMRRIVLTGEELADFTSFGFDDHIKLVFPSDGEKPVMRDYTPRAFDQDRRSLTLDFALHQAGPATAWALQAKAGDALTIAGPRGSSVIAQDFDWWLLIGDETALPAIGRQLEELPADTQVITLGFIPHADDKQEFVTKTKLESHWLIRSEQDSASPEVALAALSDLPLPQGRGFVWIGAEASVARALRDHIHARGQAHEWTKTAGYWTRGLADAADKTLD